MIRYLSLEEVYRLQQRALSEKGGMPGVRDAGAVESAVAGSTMEREEFTEWVKSHVVPLQQPEP